MRVFRWPVSSNTSRFRTRVDRRVIATSEGGRPSVSHSMPMAFLVLETSDGDCPIPCQASPWRTARRMAAFELPPIHMGGYGVCNGRGKNVMPAVLVIEPSYSSPWQRAMKARMCSSVTRPRSSKSAFIVANSSGIQPVPNPAMSRPPERTSRVVSILALSTGCLNGRTNTLIPTLTRVVAPAM